MFPTCTFDSTVHRHVYPPKWFLGIPPFRRHLDSGYTQTRPNRRWRIITTRRILCLLNRSLFIIRFFETFYEYYTLLKFLNEIGTYTGLGSTQCRNKFVQMIKCSSFKLLNCNRPIDYHWLCNCSFVRKLRMQFVKSTYGIFDLIS